MATGVASAAAAAVTTTSAVAAPAATALAAVTTAPAPASSRLRHKVAVYDAWQDLNKTRNVGQAFTVDGVRRHGVSNKLLPIHAVLARHFLLEAQKPAAQPKAVAERLFLILNAWLKQKGFLQLCHSQSPRLYDAVNSLQRRRANAIIYGDVLRAIQYSLRQTMSPLEPNAPPRDDCENTPGAAELFERSNQSRAMALQEDAKRRRSSGEYGRDLSTLLLLLSCESFPRRLMSSLSCRLRATAKETPGHQRSTMLVLRLQVGGGACPSDIPRSARRKCALS